MQAKTGPHYNLLQNVAWMIGLAWRNRKRVLVFTVLTAVLEILYNLSQLYIAPEILSRVESHAPIWQLLATIAFFTLALFLTNGAKKYIDENSLFPRVDVRSAIVGMLERKGNTTSYPNTLDADYIKLREKAHKACSSNNEATEYIWHTLGELLKNVGGFVIYLAILARLDAVLLGVVMLTCVGGFCASCYSNNWVYAHREQQDKLMAQNWYVCSTASSVAIAKDIRIFGLQNWLSDVASSVHAAYLSFRLRVERVQLLADLTEAVLTMARNGIAYVYLIRMALTENLGVPEFLLYFTAVSTLTTWITGILREVAQLHKHSLDISGVREFIEYPEVFRFDDGAPVPRADMYELKLEHVSFRYPGAERDTIHDLDLTIRAGEKLAIVGLNGAGKSTLVKLLCGLFDPTSGRVLLNGRDIREFDRREYYKLFSAVFQEFSVLNVTVAENVAQTHSGIDYDRVWDCLEKAGMADAVRELPHGLDTHVGREVFLDGVLFSGGQTQRLMLARALYRDGPILALDEPTAALDPIAENDIYVKYNDMTRGKTSVFISHRLASTRFCDRIIYMADGRIAEEGTHSGLMAQGGEYARLFDVQSRYYQEGRDF